MSLTSVFVSTSAIFGAAYLGIKHGGRAVKHGGKKIYRKAADSFSKQKKPAMAAEQVEAKTAETKPLANEPTTKSKGGSKAKTVLKEVGKAAAVGVASTVATGAAILALLTAALSGK